MIIDLILDRKDDIKDYGKDYYNPKHFYCSVLGYESEIKSYEISTAMDYGTENDVKKALCDYILKNDYNPKICEFINSVNWL